MAAANSQEIEERTLVLSRTFEAPRALVFKVWTQPEHLARWWGPKGFTLISYKTDVRVGGSYRFGVRSPENTEHWAHGIYREIAPPERLVFTHAWEFPDGKPKHETTITLTFAEQGEKTKLTLKQTLFESVTARDLHRGGWSSTLDLLDEYLATL
ncbi:MAG: SRPBCC domain-containing protein [Dongiaceae bacterium]